MKNNYRIPILATIAAMTLSGADLSMGASNPAPVAPGGTTTVPVSYRAAGAQVVALSFDLLYDKSKFTITADSGPAATAARKAVQTSELPGGTRVLVLSSNILDLTLVSDGVIASLSIRVAAGAAAGTSTLQIANSTGSDANGRSVTVTATNGSIAVAGGGGGGSTNLTFGSGSPVSVSPGGTATVSVSYRQAASALVAMSMDLLYDKASLTVTADVGPAATVARKTVQASDLAGGIRVLLLGSNILDLTPVGDGVVVNLTIRASSTASGVLQVQLANTTGSDANGRSVTMTATGGSVSVSTAGGGGGATGKNQVLSHIVDGGAWTTQFVFVNLDDRSPTQVSLNFFKQDGTPLPLAIAGETGQTPTVVRAIASGGSVTIETNGDPRADTRVGWAELVTTGRVAGQGVFRSLGVPDQFAAVALTSSATRILMPFDNVGGALTGMAIINTNKTAPMQAEVVIRDERGQSVLTDVVVLPANGHASFDFPSKWRQTVDRRGIIELKASTADITGLGFRFVASAFSSLPVIVLQ